MKKQTILLAALFAAISPAAMAGGYLTNTNQSISFLREPSRDAVIAIDGAYSNPAGLLFMPEGFQIQFNYQNVVQHRYIESTFAPFALGTRNGNSQTKKFEGEAKAPFLPSLHVSYNLNEKWNVNGSFMVVGGGGKCEFDGGLPSFEAILPGIAVSKNVPMESYDLDCSLIGKQYYFGVQVGAGYKVSDYLAVSLQGRVLIGTASYEGNLQNIKMSNTPADTYLLALSSKLSDGAQQALAGAAQYEAVGLVEQANALKAQAAGYQQQAAMLKGYAGVAAGVDLDCEQSGIGFTPIIGIDWRPNEKWNFAAKYEFKTKMRLKNSSNVKDVVAVAALNQFKDGNKVPEDMPAYFTIGAQYSPIPTLNINAGWHCYYDKQASKYNDAQKLLRHNTHEWNAGIEWNCWKNLTVSGGWQNTCYGNSDAYMKDISFTTSSNTYGFGLGYKLCDSWYIDLGYFFTKYKKYTKESADYNGTSLPGKDTFWRDNKVIGLGVTYKL